MHLKNWSLNYPDGRNPLLSPAYDLVSTIPYIPSDGMALNFAGKRAFSDITKTRFASFAQKAKISERETLLTMERIAQSTLDSWTSLKTQTAMDGEMVKTIDRHLEASARRLG